MRPLYCLGKRKKLYKGLSVCGAKLLMYSNGTTGRIEIKCPKCGCIYKAFFTTASKVDEIKTDYKIIFTGE